MSMFIMMRAQTVTLGQSIMMILLEEFTVPIDGFRGLPVIFEHVPHPFYARTPIGHVYHVHRIQPSSWCRACQ